MVQVLSIGPFSVERERAVMASAVCRFTAYAPLSQSALEALMALAQGHRHVAKGEFVVHEGDAPGGVHLLLAGWTASSVAFADGRRQLIKVHLAGDLLGLPSLALSRTADSIVALTPAVLASIPPAAIGRLFEHSPRLAALLFLISQEERVVLMDRLASIGASAAINRVAALLLEVHARLCRADPTTGDAFDFPMLQSDVADMIGVTSAHLNRTVKRMRAEGAVTWQRQRVTILDFAALTRSALLPRRVLGREPGWLPAER